MTEDNNYEPKILRRSSRHHIRDVAYHVNEWGDPDAPLIVMLHGWGDTGGCFQFVVDALTDNWYVVAPDWRGFGESRHRAGSYWFPDYLADLHELLAIYSGAAPAHLVGHSMGANVAGLYAGVMPERVATLVNIEGFGLADRDPADTPENYRRWIEAGHEHQAFATYESFEELVPRIVRRSPRMDRDKALFVARQWADQGRDGVVRLRADPAHKLPNAVLYRRAEATACWDRVEAPVLLVMGAETSFTSTAVSWIDPDTERHPFHGAPTETVPEAGHMIHFEQPARLAALIEAFIRPRL